MWFGSRSVVLIIHGTLAIIEIACLINENRAYLSLSLFADALFICPPMDYKICRKKKKKYVLHYSLSPAKIWCNSLCNSKVANSLPTSKHCLPEIMNKNIFDESHNKEVKNYFIKVSGY